MNKSNKEQHYSGIGGQAVLEGVMMRAGTKYAIAVRRKDGSITIRNEEYKGILYGSVVRKIPVVRGFFAFLDSMVLGLRCTDYSAAMYEPEETGDSSDQVQSEQEGSSKDKLFSAAVMIFAFALAIVLFVILPLKLTDFIGRFVASKAVLAVVEGVLRLVIFLLYVTSISLMKDIRRLYQYHGAEHKCINCLERGLELNVENVRESTRLHKRCGSSFMLFVMMVSIITFFFIRVSNPLMKIVLRIIMIPIISGISFEIIRIAGKSDNKFIQLISKPGLWLQMLTTKEPNDDMIEIGIASVEAVFDWRAYLRDEFGKIVSEREDLDTNESDQKEMQDEKNV